MSKARKQADRWIKRWNREVGLLKRVPLDRRAEHVGEALFSRQLDTLFGTIQRVPNATLRQQLMDALQQLFDAQNIKDGIDRLFRKPANGRRR